MSQPKNEDELTEKQKKEGYSIIVVLIGVVIIGASFVWHLWSALSPTP
jgi:F0F1-type ATP synthase assembly protein I